LTHARHARQSPLRVSRYDAYTMAVRMQPRGYSLVRALSPGPAFATWLVKRDVDGALCVVKRAARAEKEAETQLAREAEILHVLRGARGAAPQLAERGADAGGPFLVMHQLPWETLAASAPSCTSLRDSAFRLHATRALFASLASIHEASDARGPLAIVHGDVAPTNAYVDPKGQAAAFADFGLARYRSVDPAGNTVRRGPPEDGTFRGTLLYAAPELARGERDLDPRADLFALAASILHASTGVAPRRASSFAALLGEAAEDPVTAYDALAPSLFAPHLARALLACLAFDRASRPTRARDLFVVIDSA
jgi:serine/threonine protein kinase